MKFCGPNNINSKWFQCLMSLSNSSLLRSIHLYAYIIIILTLYFLMFVFICQLKIEFLNYIGKKLIIFFSANSRVSWFRSDLWFYNYLYTGNIGNVPLVLVAALCRDKANPFGDSDQCAQDGNAYISFGQWVGYKTLLGSLYDQHCILDFLNKIMQQALLFCRNIL